MHGTYPSDLPVLLVDNKRNRLPAHRACPRWTVRSKRPFVTGNRKTVLINLTNHYAGKQNIRDCSNFGCTVFLQLGHLRRRNRKSVRKMEIQCNSNFHVDTTSRAEENIDVYQIFGICVSLISIISRTPGKCSRILKHLFEYWHEFASIVRRSY